MVLGMFGGEWNTGFIIEDESGNQYVWVPTLKLVKKDFIVNANIQKEYCLDDNYEEFMKSVISNGGFYISRYESGVEEGKVVFKANMPLLQNVTKNEVTQKIKAMYEEEEFTCELINGYAYDTVIEWLKSDSEIEVFDIDVDLALTGRNANKNIFDLFDNVLEYTSETSYDTIVIRGALEEDFSKENSRYAILKEENNFRDNTILTARTIIYK